MSHARQNPIEGLLAGFRLDALRVLEGVYSWRLPAPPAGTVDDRVESERSGLALEVLDAFVKLLQTG